eukprot:1233198-Rhodomonas_salina.1
MLVDVSPDLQVLLLTAPGQAGAEAAGACLQVLQKKRDCQTIVISPLSMAAVPDGPDITKIKMKEVDRTQNVLA